MKKLINKTNIIKFIISIILSFLFFISLIFIYEGNRYNSYKLYTDSNKGNISIKEIWINGSKQNLKTILNDFYKEDKDMLVIPSSNKNILEIKLPKTYEFNIIFLKNSESGIITLEKNNKVSEKINLEHEEPEEYLLITNNSSNKHIIMNYIKNDIKVSHVLISIISTIIYYCAITSLLYFIRKIKYDKLKYRDIIMYYTSTLLILSSVYYILIEIFHSKITLLLGLLIILGLIYIKPAKKIKIENLFIYLIIPLSIIFCLTLLPENVPDENSHFYKSYIYANKVLGNNLDNDNDYCIQTQHQINSKLGEFNYDVFNSAFTINTKAYYSDIKYINDSYDNFKDINCFHNVEKLPFVAYTITTLSLIISKIFNFPIIIAYYLGKLMNLLFYISVVYFAIKIIPKFKKSLLLVSTLPIAIQQAGAYNQDCVHNALFILLFAMIIKLIYSDEKINIKKIIPIIIISILLAMCKMGYFPIILLCLLIPKKKFETKKQHIIFKSLLIVPMVLVFILLYFKSWNTISLTGDLTNTETYSIMSLFNNPIDFIRLYINTFKEMGFYMLIQGVVDGFAWSTKYNSTFITYIIVLCYTLFISSINRKEKNNKKYIVLIFFISIFICGLILTSMLGQNSIGARYIDGLQPRYFIPCLLLLSTLFNFNIIKIEKNKEHLFYGILITIILLCSIVTLINGFYV